MTLAKRIALHISRLQMGQGQEMRRTQFAELVPQPSSVVMLGDSITEGGDWHDGFQNPNTITRGSGGETAEQVLARTDTAINAPRAVFILIGTNDLVLRYTPEEVAANVSAILRRIQAATPGTRLYVQSIMPRGPRWRQSITITNTLLAVVARQHDAEYLDLWPALADDNGNLRRGFSLDGLHLTGAGYRAWCDELDPHMAELATSPAVGA